jgi:hypothetical protein
MPSPFTAADVGREGRMARCEGCGTSWLARQLPEDGHARARALARPPLIIEGEACRLRPRIAPVAPPRFGQGPRPSVETGKPAAKPENGVDRRPRGGRGLAAIIAVAFAVLAGLVAPILTALPGLAGLFADDELAFANVKSTFLRAHGHDAIVVEGDLVNTTAHGVAIPAIRISLRDARSEEVYSWLVEPTASALDAGESLGFRSALAGDALQQMGYTDVISLDGGWRAYQGSGLPVEK